MDYSNWMGLTTAIHGLPLGNICLPATHDSGTYGLTTYQDIISTGSPSSKAILVNAGYPTLSNLEPFWPRTYSPPDDEGKGGVVAGDYSNSSDLTQMRSFQQSEYGGRGSLPFALYMLLTPQVSDVIGVVSRTLATALYRQVDRISSEAPSVGAALQAIAASLPTQAPEWTTLQQLSLDVDTNIGSNISQVVGTLPSPNPLSMIYADFYDVTNLVDLAIQYSTGQPGRNA